MRYELIEDRCVKESSRSICHTYEANNLYHLLALTKKSLMLIGMLIYMLTDADWYTDDKLTDAD